MFSIKDSQWSAASFRENADPELMNWLKQQGADLDTIRRVKKKLDLKNPIILVIISRLVSMKEYLFMNKFAF